MSQLAFMTRIYALHLDSFSPRLQTGSTKLVTSFKDVTSSIYPSEDRPTELNVSVVTSLTTSGHFILLNRSVSRDIHTKSQIRDAGYFCPTLESGDSLSGLF